MVLKVLSILIDKSILVQKNATELSNVTHAINIFLEALQTLLSDFLYANLFRSLDDVLLFFRLMDYNHKKIRVSALLTAILQ